MLFSVKQSCTFKIYAITRCSFLYIVIRIMELAYSNTSRPTSDTAYLLTFIDFFPLICNVAITLLLKRRPTALKEQKRVTFLFQLSALLK